MKKREVPLHASSEHLKQLYNQAPFGYQSLDENGCLIEVNQTWLDKLSYTRDEVIGRNFGDFLHPDWQDHFKEYFPRFKAIGETLGTEFEMVRKDGTTFSASFDGKILYNAEGLFQQTLCIFLDLTEQQRAINALRQRESFLSAIIENQPGLLWLKDREGRFLSVNTTFAKSCGLDDPELLIGKTDLDVWPRQLAVRYIADDAKVLKSGKPYTVEEPIFAQGTFKWFETCRTPIIDKHGAVIGTTGYSHDITERLQARAYREMSREVLQVLNEPIDLSASLQRVIDILIQRTEFDAVGIRLQAGDDFPYFAHRGFHQNFLLTENSVLGRSPNGDICRDETGNIALECTCGLVLSGKTDPNSPLFTAGGSFWTNDSAQLLNLPASEDPRLHPRNQCIHHNYNSFALVPIRTNEKIIGLIHCSDERKDCFTLNSIELLEGIASHIGAALMRKQAEEDLQAERKRLADIIEFLPDATFAIDTKGHVILWNNAMESMTGVSAAQILGKGDHAYSIPFYGEPRPQLIDSLFKEDQDISTLYPFIIYEGDTLVTEVFCKALNGNKGGWVFAKASPLRDHTGTIIGAIESIRDITDNKNTEEKLRKSVSRFEALFNATSDAVFLINPDGMILDMNENAARRRNLDRSTMLGQNLFDFLPAEAAVVRRTAVDIMVSEKNLVQYDEARYENHYRIRLFPIMDDQGKVVQIASFSRNITESKQFDEENKRLQAQLLQAQKMETIGTMAGGIAHDFNNILGGIIGYTEIARNACPPDSPVLQSLDKVLEAGNRAAALVKQILSFSRQTGIKRVPLKIGFIVREALKFLRPTLPSTIAIKQHIDTDADTILGDPTQIHQILINLCANAFHAMEHTGGTLEITLKECSLSRQDLSLQPDVQPGSFVALSISDSGQGIETAILDKIFEPYFTTKGVGKGTGMGLSIVHGIVKSYGGFITCESELGKGTAFHVFLPASEQKQGVAANSGTQPIVGGNESILLVDDEKMLTEMGKTMLEQLGYTVTVQTSSMDALAIFQAHPDRFDVVITDQTMPDITGSELAQRMLEIRPALPIILYTGYSSIITEEQVMAIGIKGYALKPFSQNDLAALLRKVLDAKTTDPQQGHQHFMEPSEAR